MKIPFSIENWYNLKNLISGKESSDCRLPCTKVSVESKSDYAKNNDEEFDQVNLIFLSSVEVTKTEFSKFNIFEMLTFIGGNMGLWLGLGMVQFLEVFINFPIKRTERRSIN